MRRETPEIVEYLIEEGLIESYAIGGAIKLTHWGLKEYEQAIYKPEEPTAHFLPVNIINVGTMHNSSLQQGTQHSVIYQQLDTSATKELETLIKAIEEIQKTLDQSTELGQEWTCELETLQSQQRSPKPKSIIIRESLKTIRNLAEGIIGNAMAGPIIEQIGRFLG